MMCSRCGTDNLAGKMLCYKCGTDLLQAPGAVPQEGKKKGGCWRVCLTGCLVVVLIVIGVFIVLWINRERAAKFLSDKMEQAVLSVIPKEVNKEEVKKVMAEVREAWVKGELDPEKLEKAARKANEYMADGKLDKEETGKLMEMFREAIREKDKNAVAPIEGEMEPPAF